MKMNSKTWMPTYALIAINAIIYALAAFLGTDAFQIDGRILETFGQYNLAVSQGEVWRLFSSMFFHANIVHLFFNMLSLFFLGLQAEKMFDTREYLMIYFLSGLAGGLLTLVLWPADSLSVGASGAIFGILGAVIVYPLRAIRQSIVWGLFYAFLFFFINMGQNVNYLAHLGGLLCGLSTGYVLALSRKQKQTVTYQYNYSYSR